MVNEDEVVYAFRAPFDDDFHQDRAHTRNPYQGQGPSSLRPTRGRTQFTEHMYQDSDSDGSFEKLDIYPTLGDSFAGPVSYDLSQMPSSSRAREGPSHEDSDASSLEEYPAGQRRQITSPEECSTGPGRQITSLEECPTGPGRQITSLEECPTGQRRQITSLEEYPAGQRRQITSLEECPTGPGRQITSLKEYPAHELRHEAQPTEGAGSGLDPPNAANLGIQLNNEVTQGDKSQSQGSKGKH